jgi:TRAP transporter 4TM/12TM fusion protein
LKEREMAEELTRYRSLKGIIRLPTIVCPGIVLVVAVYYMFRLVVGDIVLFDVAYYYLLMGLTMPLIFLHVPRNQKSKQNTVPWYDILAFLLSSGISFFLFAHGTDIVEGTFSRLPPTYVYPLLAIFFILLMEAARRQAGMFFAVICLFFSVYPLFAKYMPGLLFGTDFSVSETLSYHMMGSEGVLGVPMRVVGGLILGYMFFAGALVAAGGAQFFTNLALSLMGHVRGGPAKVSVVASSLFGTISGSAVANVAVDGGITIPLMMRTGYPGHYAAAVEATASTGGVLMPPVMGATAFVLAEFLGISYATVCIAAAVPAVLYYLALFVQIDCRAAKIGLKGLPRESLPSLKKTLREGYIYVVAMVVLGYVLLYLKLEAQAPFYACLALLVLPMIKKSTRLRPRDFMTFLEQSGRFLEEVMAPLLGIGLIIDSLIITGVAGNLSVQILEIAGANPYVLIFLGFVVAFILGMGISITAIYVLLALLLAPALVKFGFDPLAVHLFVMYAGMISYITPPVCPACFTAAPFAGESPMRVGLQAMRLGVGIYLVPFCFILNPGIILHGPLWNIFFVIGTAALGLTIIGQGFEGHVYGIGKIDLWAQVLLCIGGVLLTAPWVMESLVGLLVSTVTITVCFLIKKRRAKELSIQHKLTIY